MINWLARSGAEMGTIGIAVAISSGVAIVVSSRNNSLFINEAYVSTLVLGLILFVIGFAAFVLGGFA
jgi:hypothetical protein